MSRFLSLVLCLVCAPAFAEPIVYTEGPLPSLLDGPSVIVSGEYFKSLKTWGDLDIEGGTFTPTGNADPQAFWLKRLLIPTITIHARYARSAPLTGETHNPGDVLIEGWLDDGSFFRFESLNEDDAPGLTLINVTPTDDPLPFLRDADGDSDLDIADLNAVRNNFGGQGIGDIDESGTVDIADLNLVRNGFGQDQFELDESHVAPIGLSHAGLPNYPVPEPASVALLLIGVTALCSRFRSRS